MAEEKKKGRKPDYKGDGVAVWIKGPDKNGNKFLSIKLAGHNSVLAFKNVPRDLKQLPEHGTRIEPKEETI